MILERSTNIGVDHYYFMDRRDGKLVMGSAIFASFVVISAVLITTYPVNQARAYPYGNDTGGYEFGTISSAQNNENGTPAWVLFGHWKGNLANNQSLVDGQGNRTLGGESFNAQFEMVRLNGSAGHTHYNEFCCFKFFAGQ